MEIPELPPAAVNYRWLPAALTTAGSSALKSGSWQSINCDFARFVEKIKKSRLIQNATKLCTSSICIFIEVSVKFRSIPTKSRFILIF